MSRIRRAVKEDLDRLVADVLFMVFGVWALFDLPDSQSSTPMLFAILFDVEFILLGGVLLAGTITQNYKLKQFGFIVYIIALSTIAALIGVVSQSAVSVLVLALAVRGITSIKELRTRKQFIEEIGQVLRSPPKDDGH